MPATIPAVARWKPGGEPFPLAGVGFLAITDLLSTFPCPPDKVTVEQLLAFEICPNGSEGVVRQNLFPARRGAPSRHRNHLFLTQGTPFCLQDVGNLEPAFTQYRVVISLGVRDTKVLAANKGKLVPVIILPAHGRLLGTVEIGQLHCAGCQQAAPDRWMSVFEVHLELESGA